MFSRMDDRTSTFLPNPMEPIRRMVFLVLGRNVPVRLSIPLLIVLALVEENRPVVAYTVAALRLVRDLL